MNKKIPFIVIAFLLIGFISKAQTIIWTGATNNDFFNESNWKDSLTNAIPNADAINPAVDINLALQISNVSTKVNAVGIIQLGTGSISIESANLSSESFSGGNVMIKEEGYVDLSSTLPFVNAVQVNFTSGIGWIRTLNYSAETVSITNLGQIKVNGNPAVYKTNLRLDNYYFKGCVIRADLASTNPMIVYDGANLQDASASIAVNKIHSGATIANGLDNKIMSFVLKKGFMATVAIENDGTGKSKNYIASESDLIINTLPKSLQNSISFIRVVPWNWVSKRGTAGTVVGLNEDWYYRWSNAGESGVDREYAPMSFGLGGGNDANDIVLYQGKYKATHVMGFNEPDNCNGQGGVNGGCIIDNAVGVYKNLMKTGLRLVSPSCTEGEATKWLKDFHTKATAQNVRIDVIAVHWYDWGNNPAVNKTPTPEQVFNRFKNYLTNIHNLYGLPIWITEFNANPNRSGAINLAFMKLALPYLENLDYIERYAWFQPSSGVANYYDANGNYTDVGVYYKDINTSPAIPEPTINANNNLNLLSYPNVALNKIATANSSYSASTLPSYAVDGDITNATSQWFLNFGVPNNLSYTPLPAWIEVDLQGSFTIDSFKTVEASNAMKDFNFEVWDGALNSGAGGWANVLTVMLNPASSLTTYKIFSPITTNKVRLNITAHNSTTYLRLFELEVFGIPSETLTVKKYEKQPFSVYPNPVKNGILTISGNQEINLVEVYDIRGNKVNTPIEKGRISVGNLSSGVYFLKINKQHTIKFIKE